jgi:Holliday junction resolvasome RuvABC endonuclease subunit
MNIGIDYSITSPAICAFHNNQYHFFAFRQKKKQKATTTNVHLLEYPLYSTPQQRYDLLATLLLTSLEKTLVAPSKAFIENYAYAGNGVVFNIAECTSIIKHKLYNMNVPITCIEPTVVKKLGCGKGNAKKRDMMNAFKDELGDPYPWFDLVDDGSEKIPSPLSDCVDAYFVLKSGLLQESNK